jgi:hypothetical protein
MVILIVNTYRYCKFTYLYVTAATFLTSSIFGVFLGVSTYWGTLCQPFWKYPGFNEYSDKCPDIGELSKRHPFDVKQLDFSYIDMISKCGFSAWVLWCMFFVLANWLIAFRYFEVAEMMGRED